MEGFQAGLSWLTILKKRAAFQTAFDDFNPETDAQNDDADIERLMTDPGIVRNRLKITAVIHNAQATIKLRDIGGLAQLIWSYQPDQYPILDAEGNPPSQSKESVALAKDLTRQGFRFVGPTTVLR